MNEVVFYSSVGGAAFTEGMFREWRRSGMIVTGCHALTERQYRAGRGRWAALRRRWRMYGGFSWLCWRSARRQRDAIRVATTNPFFAPWLVNRAAAGDGATINLVYDLFPDALVQAGVLRDNSWPARACAVATRRAMQGCDVSVFLGERLRRHAESRYGLAKRAVVIPVGADGTAFRTQQPRVLPAGEEIVLLYAGQMGRMHDSATIRDALFAGLPAGMRMRFHASGAGYQRLRREASGVAAEWGGALAEEEWRRVILESHVALVTMAPGAENIVMPSKTYSALVAGQAVLAICPSESDLADLVRAHDCGWVIEPGDVNGLCLILEEISRDRDGLQRKRLNAYRAGHAHYDSRVLAKEWLKLFEELDESIRRP